jgi:hypothetical protein
MNNNQIKNLIIKHKPYIYLNDLHNLHFVDEI